MKTIEHEGQTFVLKSDMEEVIKNRISKVTARANAAEESYQALGAEVEQLKSSGANAEQLSAQILELQGQITKHEGKFSRYRSISSTGITDPELISAIEWTYDRKMSDVQGEQKPSIGEWLSTQISDPSKAPALLRPHLSKINAPKTIPPEHAPAAIPTMQHAQNTPPKPAPNVNQGAIAAPNTGNLIQQGLRDQEFYRANRDQIRQQFQSIMQGKK